ncbi:hypothetical protein NFI96_013558, partial [Prochilodus magdalenae]
MLTERAARASPRYQHWPPVRAVSELMKRALGIFASEHELPDSLSLNEWNLLGSGDFGAIRTVDST